MKLTDADALYEKLNDAGGGDAEKNTYFAGWDDAITAVIQLLDDAPTVEVRNNIGESKMTKYENDCSILIHGEMQHGIAEHGLFHSPHEGLGVLLEELEELKEAVLDVEEAFQDFKMGIRDNDLETSCKESSQIEDKARNAMIEAMQVAAMAQKYVKTFGGSQDED